MILFTNVLEPAVLRISRDPVTVRAEWGKVGKTRRDRIFKVNPPTLFTTATWELSINMSKHQQTYETNIQLYFIKNARALLLGITYRFAGTWIERKYPGKVQACVKRKSSNVLLKNIAGNFSNHSRFYLIYTTYIRFVCVYQSGLWKSYFYLLPNKVHLLLWSNSNSSDVVNLKSLSIHKTGRVNQVGEKNSDLVRCYSHAYNICPLLFKMKERSGGKIVVE